METKEALKELGKGLKNDAEKLGREMKGKTEEALKGTKAEGILQEATGDREQVIRMAGLVAVVSAGMMIVGAFMPFIKSDLFQYTYGSDSINLVNPGGQLGDGVVIILLAALSILFVCLHKTIPAFVCAVLTFLMPFVIKHNLIAGMKKQGFSDFLEKYGKMGAGYRVLCLFAVILLLSAAVWFYYARQKEKEAQTQAPKTPIDPVA